MESAIDARPLAALEATIERGLATFIEVGQALMEIRERRLYRETHATFEDYCRERWGLKRPRAYELIEAAQTVGVLSEISDIGPPSRESHAAELARLKAEPEAVREVWAEANAETGGKPTASNIRRLVNRRLAVDAGVQERLERLPENERDDALALVSQPGIDKASAGRILDNLATRPAEQRREILEKASSPDSRERTDALTDAAGVPRMPDPRMQEVVRAASFLRHAAGRFSSDPLNARILALADQVDRLADDLMEVRRGEARAI